jgi:hypothetical protein
MNKFASIFIGAVTGATLISTSAQAASVETKKDPGYRYEQYSLLVIEDTCSDNKIEHQPYTS